ncbi:MAG: GHKL domain-containing protein [Lachnospiraceae bacterium]|nr:GHKL domain-containing protein [Lachnospiraceae bacterium]
MYYYFFAHTKGGGMGIGMKEVVILLLNYIEAVKIYLLMHFMSGTKERSYKKKSLLAFFLIMIAGIMNICIGKNIVNYIIMTVIVVCLFFENRIYKNIIWSIWAAPVVSLFDYFWVVILQFLLNVDRNNSNAGMLDIAASICTILTITFIGTIYKKINREGYRLPIVYYAAFAVVISVNGLLLNIYVTGVQREYKIVPVGIMVCVCLCMLGLVAEMLAILVLGCLHYMYREKEKMQEEIIHSQIQQYKDLELREENTRRFRHDIRDHVHILKQLIVEKNYNDALTYVNSMDNTIDSLKVIDVGNNSVNAVLSHYYILAEDVGTTLQIYGSLPGRIYVADYDLCTILANILRNAVTAATEDTIKIYFKHDDEYIYIQEENPCDKNIYIHNNIPETSKSDKRLHGYGIANIKRIVDKNKGLLSIYAENGRFEIKITLKNRENV